MKKKYTRKQFADRETNLRKMRRNDPTLFEQVFCNYCARKNLDHIVKQL